MKFNSILKILFWVSLIHTQYIIYVQPLTLKTRLDFFSYDKDQDFSSKDKENERDSTINNINNSYTINKFNSISNGKAESTELTNQSNQFTTSDVLKSLTLLSHHNDDDNFTSQLQSIMENMSNLNSSNKIKINDSQKNLVEMLNVLVKKYMDLKEEKRKAELNKENSIEKFKKNYFLKNAENKKRLFKNDTPEVIHDNVDYLQKFRFKSLAPDAVKIVESDERKKDSMKYKASAYNIILNKPGLVVKNKEKLTIDNTLLHKMRLDNSYSENVIARSVPLQDCNKNWDYRDHGENWNCMVGLLLILFQCECGSEQSPVDIKFTSLGNENSTSSNNNKNTAKNNSDSITNVKLPDNVFFDFADHKCEEQFYCPMPLIKNTGNTLEVKYNCGKLILPPHLNGYSCYKIEFHTPSEHKISKNSKF